ncbi:hypothetical protein PR048_000370 [Dryococelus australis]|uniref:Uncharacterized protein n=1 Tax=Dryococelus australis TaxID=614101 RepID=A0ABQ9IFQ9_9NEOP|nr:hypothetical protein PR048_000370 [Dryococelus australis]
MRWIAQIEGLPAGRRRGVLPATSLQLFEKSRDVAYFCRMYEWLSSERLKMSSERRGQRKGSPRLRVSEAVKSADGKLDYGTRCAYRDSYAPVLWRIELMGLSLEKRSGHRPSLSQRDSGCGEYQVLDTRGSVALIAPAPLGRKRGKKLQKRGSYTGDPNTHALRLIARTRKECSVSGVTLYLVEVRTIRDHQVRFPAVPSIDFHEWETQQTLLSPVHTGASAVCSLAVGSEACRAGPINYDPIAKSERECLRIYAAANGETTPDLAHTAGECTTCIQVDLKQGFQECSFHREQRSSRTEALAQRRHSRGREMRPNRRGVFAREVAKCLPLSACCLVGGGWGGGGARAFSGGMSPRGHVRELARARVLVVHSARVATTHSGSFTPSPGRHVICRIFRRRKLDERKSRGFILQQARLHNPLCIRVSVFIGFAPVLTPDQVPRDSVLTFLAVEFRNTLKDLRLLDRRRPSANHGRILRVTKLLIGQLIMEMSSGNKYVANNRKVTADMTSVHNKVITFEINLRGKSLLLHAYILTGALSGMRPVKLAMTYGKAEECTMSIQVDLKQGFQKCSFYREHPIVAKTVLRKALWASSDAPGAEIIAQDSSGHGQGIKSESLILLNRAMSQRELAYLLHGTKCARGCLTGGYPRGSSLFSSLARLDAFPTPIIKQRPGLFFRSSDTRVLRTTPKQVKKDSQTPRCRTYERMDKRLTMQIYMDTFTFTLSIRTHGQYHLGSALVHERPIMNAVQYRGASGGAWTNRTMASSNTDTNRAGVLAVVDIAEASRELERADSCKQAVRALYCQALCGNCVARVQARAQLLPALACQEQHSPDKHDTTVPARSPRNSRLLAESREKGGGRFVVVVNIAPAPCVALENCFLFPRTERGEIHPGFVNTDACLASSRSLAYPSPPSVASCDRDDVVQRRTLALWRSAGMKVRGKREIPEKARRPTSSSGTIPTCENPE